MKYKIQILRTATPAVLLATLILFPFLGKAFTIDDTVFLFEARHAIQDPLHPTAFEMTWEHAPERVSRMVPTGPVMAWLLVPSVLAGGSEWLAHAVQLAMLWIAIVATVSLALRFGLTPAWASVTGLLLVAMPAVLAMTGTAMPDIPAMTLGIAGLERLVAWNDDRRPLQGISAVIFLGLAPLARTHMVFLFGIGVLFLVRDVFSISAWRAGPWSRFLPLLAAPLITTAVYSVTNDRAYNAGSIIGAAIRYSSTARLASNIVAFSTHWVLALAFALPWTALRWRSILGRPWVLLAATAAAMGLLFQAHRGNAPYAIVPIAALGVAALVDVFTDSFRRRDGIQLALGVWLLLPLSAVVYTHLPSKYLIVSAPAAVLLIGRECAARSGRMSWIICGATILLGVGLGVAILRADEAFAGVGKRVAAELIAPRVATGQRVWFVGRWGFQWYAEKAGARPATLTPPYPSPGDALVVSVASARSDEVLTMIGMRYPRQTYLTHIEESSPGGRIMNRRLGAGFYSNFSGYWPWVWGDSVIDAFYVFQID